MSLAGFFRRILRKIRKPSPRQLLKMIRIGAILFAPCIVFLVGLFFVYANDLPDPSKINSRDVVESTKIFDRNNELLYEIHGEVKRTLIGFDEMPEHVKQATVAVEDADFYEHRGINFRGLLRALFRDITQGKTEGGSSITQQLVKNALLSGEKTLVRKFKELVLTIQIEQHLSKDDILKLYLNEIPYGQNAYGIEAASQTYFNKSARNLTLAESAYLAALPQRPSYFNPFGSHLDDLEIRKNYALQRMSDLGYITAAERDAAQKEEVKFNPSRTGIKAPHFVIYIQELLEEHYGKAALEEGGFKVTTTLDYELQKMAEESVSEGAPKFERYGATNAGLVAVDPSSGDILAMVGSKDFFDEENQGQVNIALRERQPGSSFKPYAYATAFAQGLNPATMLMDVRTVFGTVNGQPYAPQNYTGDEFGPLSMRRTLAGSLNIPAVKTVYLAGVKEVINTARDMGITTELSASTFGLSLVLGGCEIKLLDHTAAFGVLANGGIKHETKAILKIEDAKDDVVFEVKDEKEGKRVLNEEVAYLISDVLSDDSARAYIFGAGGQLTLSGRPVAAKTGTTQNWRDGWAMGYTPQLAAGVWVGNMSGKVMNPGADGSVVAAPIWNSFMRKAHADKPILQFKRPEGIIEVEVDALSGKLPTEATYLSGSGTKIEKFASFAPPAEYDNIHQLIKINSNNGLLATTDTPPEFVESKLYTVFRSERPEDSDWETPVKNWVINHGYSYPPTQKDGNGELLSPESDEPEADNDAEKISFNPSESLFISRPESGDAVSGTMRITIEATGPIPIDDINIYLRDSQGVSTKIEGEGTVQQSSNITTLNISWRPTPSTSDGNYTLFASTPQGLRSNFVNISLK